MSSAPHFDTHLRLFAPSDALPLVGAGPRDRTLQRTGRPAARLEGEWALLEDPAAAEATLAGLRAAPRFEAYRRPDLYELAYPGYPGDLEFYLDKGRHGRVLYLGVGTGRIFSALAQQNSQAVGVEASPDMHALWCRRNPQLSPERVVLSDALVAPFSAASFDTVLAPYSFLEVVAAPVLRPLLHKIHYWLSPGGVLYADTCSPYIIPFRSPGLEMTAHRAASNVNVTIYMVYDHLSQHLTEMASIVADQREQVLEMSLQYYFPREVAAAFVEAGLSAPAISGGYRDEPFDPVTNEVIVYRATRP